MKEILDGLKLYFDKALGNILLYRFERAQYADVRKLYSDKSMSEIYGAEHLLRLFSMFLYLTILYYMQKKKKTLFD